MTCLALSIGGKTTNSSIGQLLDFLDYSSGQVDRMGDSGQVDRMGDSEHVPDR